jgi:hypothetical protein
MTEAEFERQQALVSTEVESESFDGLETAVAMEPGPSARTVAVAAPAPAKQTRAPRGKPSKPRRVQRMFAIEEEVDKKLWLYAIHVGKDRSEVVNDLLRPLVASMVLYDSRDRRSASRPVEVEADGDGRVGE